MEKKWIAARRTGRPGLIWAAWPATQKMHGAGPDFIPPTIPAENPALLREQGTQRGPSMTVPRGRI